MHRGSTVRSALALLTVAAMLLAFAGSALATPATPGWQEPTHPGWQDDEAHRGWIQSKIEHMTLEEKVGQVFMIHVYGKTAEDPNYEQANLNNGRGAKNFVEAINKYHVGGVIYFNWTDNILTPIDTAQTQKLSNDIQAAAMAQRMPIPLLIATDQEGGVVARVTEPATVFPGNMALAATRSADYAARSAEIMGRELRALGINFNLAPVMDVNVNYQNPVIGVRSFSENPDLVAEMGVAQVLGYAREGVIASAKHFPGHGDTNVDSHYGLPIINHDRATLDAVDLKPFKAAIDAGVDSIMTAHIVVPALDDSGLPATLSRPILTDLLRGELGYDGIIITDSLGMSGANVYPPDRIPVEAFKAGADILLNPPDVDVAYNGLLNAVKSGEISEKRLDESVYRILRVKMKQGLFDNPYAAPESLSLLGTPDSLALADEMTNKSITLVKNDGVLPLAAGAKVLVTGPSAANPAILTSALNSRGLAAEGYSTGTSPTTTQINTAVAKAAAADVVIVTTYLSSSSSAAQARLVNALLATGRPVVVAAMRNPYDLMAFPSVNAYLAAYGFRAVSVNALARVLVGEVNPSGKLPVTIPGLYEFGTGLGY
ncbi:MAG: glycoside hydrolase family 3 protein [Bacillota bacterium]